MSNPVDELFRTPIPEKVWHYTSLRALEGILTSGRMWATDARFTNDEREFVHARDIAESCLPPLEATEIMRKYASLDLRGMLHHAFDKGALSPEHIEVYMISFSEASDLVSQWKQYADAATGVSIAFDLRYIRPLQQAEIAVTFAPCVYQPDHKEKLIRSAFSRFTSRVELLDTRIRDENWVKDELRTWRIIDRIFRLAYDPAEFHRINEGKFKKELGSAWTRTLFDLLRVASHCKHDSFSTENEWRLAMPRSPGGLSSTEHAMKFRGASGKVPYFDSNLFRTGALPIVEIMTAPFCTEIDKLQDIVKLAGYTCPITKSKAPLRDTRSL
jgi:hypothetical protein